MKTKQMLIKVEQNEAKDFSRLIKAMGYHWFNNQELLPNTNTFGLYLLDDDTIGKVSAMCWTNDNTIPHKTYAELKNANTKIVTSESVNIGHPDKTCDVIADAFLDCALSQDKNAMMAVECAIKNNKLFVYGEATTTAKIDYTSIAKQVLKEIGYTQDFDIICEISEQSLDINQAVVRQELCANDQGIVYGYATNETSEYMPLPIMLAHKIMMRYNEFRKVNHQFFADAKCQVSVEYVCNQPTRIDTILLSASHSEDISNTKIVEEIKTNVIDVVTNEYANLLIDTKYLINPSGRFTIWGSFGDSGCVGRKIVVDTYGGVGRVGGGCFSSKNATKVDRSGAYYARYVAKNIVAHGYCDRCEIQVAYAIGVKEPVAIYIDTFNTEKTDKQAIYDYVKTNFDFSVGNMINELDLLKPIYKQTACFGHFGRDTFAWEQIKN